MVYAGTARTNGRPIGVICLNYILDVATASMDIVLSDSSLKL